MYNIRRFWDHGWRRGLSGLYVCFFERKGIGDAMEAMRVEENRLFPWERDVKSNRFCDFHSHDCFTL